MVTPYCFHPSAPVTPLEDLGLKRMHFIGVGGVGMSAVALGALGAGIAVSGSDLSENRYTELLKSAGARIFLGHSGDNLRDAEAIVISSAIREQNLELRTAREDGLPILHRAEVLASLLARRKSICVAGSHGKTTTTAMIGLTLQAAGCDPSVYVGGYVQDFDGNTRLGNGGWAVAEADESDGSFLSLPTDLAVVTNIDLEHLDYWGDQEELLKGFRRFLRHLRPGGYAMVNEDDRGTRSALRGLGVPVRTWSLQAETANFVARDIEWHPMGSTFEFRYEGEARGRVRLAVPGHHNISNATAAIGVALSLGGEFDRVVEALSRFRGVARRFQVLGEASEVMAVDDYAHHPTEVAVTLAAARKLADTRAGRLLAVFQPHRYSRTFALFRHFRGAFDECDEVIVTDVYGAGERPIEGVSGFLVSDTVSRGGHERVTYVPRSEDVVRFLLPRLQAGDVVLTLGAGDIGRVAEGILSNLARRSSVASSGASSEINRSEVSPW